MRTIGMLGGLLLGGLLQSGCPLIPQCPDDGELSPGRYDVRVQNSTDTAHQIQVFADGRVVESFVRGGKKFEIVYRGVPR
jgi:hypothetical protein